MVPQIAKLLRKERLSDATLCKPAWEVVAETLGAGEADLGGGLFKKPGATERRQERRLSCDHRLSATARTKTLKRMGVSAVEDDVLATAHGLAAALHRVGALMR